MIRLLDYSKTGKHLKLQHTFSSKKYPIYYSYDPQTLETYITKVITRESDVISCYKHHIQNNILPYLQRRRDFNNASVINVPVDDAEIVVKINQEQKNKNVKLIRQKMEEVIKLMEAYNFFHDRNTIQQEIQTIDEFLSSLQIKEENLSHLVRETRDLMQETLYLLKFIQTLEINMQEVIERLESIKKGNKTSDEPLENMNSIVQELKKKGTSIDYQFLKENEKKQLAHHVQKFQRYLYYKSEYLRELKQTEEEAKMDVHHQRLLKYQQELEDQEKRIYEANTIFITKKLINGMTLREMILKKDQRLTPQFCFDLSRAIVDFLFLHGGIKDLFITTQNIIVEDSGAFHLNYFSFVGLQFIKLRKYVPRSDFQEILPYIHSKYIYNNETKNMDIQVMLRFIIINFISALFKKDILFDPKSIDFQIEVDPSSVWEQITHIQKKLFSKILTNEEKDKIKEFDDTYKVKYFELAQYLFTRDTKYVKPNLTWQFILSKLSRSTDGSYCVFNTESPSLKGPIDLLYIDNNYNLKPSATLDLFYVINISIMEVIDHYTNILNHIVKDKHFKEKVRPKNREKIERIAGKLMDQQQGYEKRGWYTQQLFVPIKMQMSFTQILGHSSWTQMLYNQRQPHVQTIKGVEKLFTFLLQTEEILILIQPFLTQQILKQALKDEKCTYYQNISHKSYYSHLHSHKPKKYDQNEINIDQQEEGNKENNFELSSQHEQDMEQESFKKMFWKCFFTTFKIIYTLIKKYYIQIHEIDINGRMVINEDKYARLLEEFRPEIPPMTVDK